MIIRKRPKNISTNESTKNNNNMKRTHYPRIEISNFSPNLCVIKVVLFAKSFKNKIFLCVCSYEAKLLRDIIILCTKSLTKSTNVKGLIAAIECSGVLKRWHYLPRLIYKEVGMSRETEIIDNVLSGSGGDTIGNVSLMWGWLFLRPAASMAQ